VAQAAQICHKVCQLWGFTDWTWTKPWAAWSNSWHWTEDLQRSLAAWLILGSYEGHQRITSKNPAPNQRKWQTKNKATENRGRSIVLKKIKLPNHKNNLLFILCFSLA